MTKLLHIVGSQGSGKTTLALHLVELFKAQGKRAAVPQDEDHYNNADLLKLIERRAIRGQRASEPAQSVDVLIIEHQQRPPNLHLQRGDKVITIEVAA